MKQQKCSIPKLAEALGVDKRTLKRWLLNTEPAGMESGHPVYTLNQAADAMRENRDKAKTRSGARERLLTAQAERAELQIGILRGEFVRADDVERNCARVAMQARHVLDQMARSAAPQVIGVSVAEAESILKETVREALTLLSQSPAAMQFTCEHCGHVHNLNTSEEKQ